MGMSDNQTGFYGISRKQKIQFSSIAICAKTLLACNNNYACKPTCIIFMRKVIKWRHQSDTFGTYRLGGYVYQQLCNGTFYMGKVQFFNIF